MDKKILMVIFFIIINIFIFAKEYKEITVVSDNNYPPYIFLDENKVSKGIIVDQWKLWEKKTGIKVKLVVLNWSDAIKYFNSGKADVIDTIFYNEERNKIYDFTKPYAKLEVPVFYSSEISGIASIEDLKGFTIAVKEGDACIDILKENNISTLVEYKGYKEIIDLAKENEVKVFCVDKPPALYYLYKLNIEKKFKMGPLLYTGEFHRAVKKGNLELVEIIENGFKKITNNEKKDIDNRWFGKSFNGEIVYSIFYVILFLLIVIGIFVIVIIGMRAMVMKKTEDLSNALNEIKAIEKRNSALLYAIPDILFIQRKDGVFIDYYSKDGHELLVGHNDIVGKSMYDMPFSKEVLDIAAKKIERVIKEDILQIFEYELDLLSGKKYFEARVAKYGGNEVVWICRDITDKKNSDKEILESREKAEEANRAKSQFLANMSHEIRTPLNGVMGMIQLLKITDLTSEQNEYMNIMEFSSEALLAIINDILDISKIEAGKVEISDEEFSLYELAENISCFISAAAEEKGVELILFIEKNVPEYVISDSGKIKQILINILNNAVKFTDVGEIKFNVMKYKEKDDFVWLRFEIIDTGIGIEKGKMENLFQKFYQADYTSTKRYGGTGLGLAISKEMAKILDGDIDVESHYGKGSSFYLTLKLQKGTKKNKKELCSFKNKNSFILAADNNISFLESLNKIFLEEGINIIAVDNSPEAYMMIEKNIVDWFILDHDLSGAEDIIKRFIEIDEMNRNKIILLSPLDKSKVKGLSEKYGIEKIVKKPLKRIELFAEICDNQKTENKKGEFINEKNDSEAVNVLVVEDNRINQLSIEGLLNVFGHRYDIFDSAEEGIEAFKQKKYDVILMDIGLPGMDGFKAIRIIRDLERGAQIPIIAVTAYATSEDRSKCMAAGADDYLPKPYRIDDLKNIIAKYLKK